MLRVLVALLGFLCSQIAFAQFNFFEQMFGGHHQQQQHRPSGESLWAAQSENVQCSSYLCPETLVCVEHPVDCPCPNVEDIKCIVPDVDDAQAGTRVCVRGVTDCKAVERLSEGW
ncbi:hypothetical protein PUNSTDRAFT_85267 [Punctularia strigosozonata HHB-11173 SS5]|uniref:uncharacterized protein n=1 Tax=Punctularia strigosozonata (strain HHB-11173) TaxID=741275 RepID=UPI0004416448|nr:uncharacterized protein PUNSTDRAFT_85267 [Punctularia strigosozonata HHB-11173 SS5]EIN10870.1 hypothetical protein PUNSTDRAFT_85267 [Punctularia strigosozonata HHB-11173 SS5]